MDPFTVEGDYREALQRWRQTGYDPDKTKEIFKDSIWVPFVDRMNAISNPIYLPEKSEE